jgi:hypothetical protein
MKDVSDTSVEEIKLRPKKGSCVHTDVAPCTEGEQLKQEYDSALQEWRKQVQPRVQQFVEGEVLARLASQLREEALTERNAAANRMYLHRAKCATCRRRR